MAAAPKEFVFRSAARPPTGTNGSSDGASILEDFIGEFFFDGRYKMEAVLGAGSYGKVYRAFDTHTPFPHQYYAIKCMVTAPEGSRLRSLQDNELELHRRVSKHPNVVRMRGAFQERGFTFVVMSLRQGGDLLTRSARVENWCNEEWIRRVFLQTVDAVMHCHEKGIYHRDLKLDNILCSGDGRKVFLCDFGLSTENPLCDDFRVGTMTYMPPECLAMDVDVPDYPTERCDLWALGVTLFKLVTWDYPWDLADSTDAQYKAFLDNEDDSGHFVNRVSVPLSSECSALFKAMLAPDVWDRLTLVQIKSIVQNISFYTFEAPGKDSDESSSSGDETTVLVVRERPLPEGSVHEGGHALRSKRAPPPLPPKHTKPIRRCAPPPVPEKPAFLSCRRAPPLPPRKVAVFPQPAPPALPPRKTPPALPPRPCAPPLPVRPLLLPHPQSPPALPPRRRLPPTLPPRRPLPPTLPPRRN